jgi:protein involved in polysaccharide export with SLBB domain
VGDVLDIRLSNTAARESTLFTVLTNGTIEYPLLMSPLPVVGMGTDEIAQKLAAQIKVITAPKISVSVRDYASHTIVITGLVDNPGKKVLRRENMPLFAVLAEASPRPEASALTVTHNGKEGAPVSLQNQQELSTIVSAGDVIKVTAGTVPANQFVYVGGDVTSPGEKTFRPGMTLTQVLISAGASPSAIKSVKVAKRNRDGLLTTNDYNVRSIQQGKLPDPFLEAGDRIDVRRE